MARASSSTKAAKPAATTKTGNTVKAAAPRKTKAKAVALPAAPEPFQANSLKRKQFATTGDAHILGDVTITTQLVVGGDLLIDGDLIAEEVFCLGKLTVTGDIQVQSLYIGQALDAGGHVDVEFLVKTGCQPEWMANLLAAEDSDDSAEHLLEKLVHPAILARHSHADVIGGFGDIQCLGYLSCGDLDCQGSVQLDEDLEAGEVLFIGGHLAASAVHVRGDCNVQGELFSESDLDVAGSLYAAELQAQGNIRAGSIGTQGDVIAWGYVRAENELSSLFGEIHAGRWIGTRGNLYAAKYIKAGEAVVAEKGMTCGSDYGIFAGSILPRSKWEKQGFISASSKPKLILSGAWVESKKLRQLDTAEKKRAPELDWEIARQARHDMLQQAD
jgi:cytoskeletal protein CcmA (bactofilin family)